MSKPMTFKRHAYKFSSEKLSYFTLNNYQCPLIFMIYAKPINSIELLQSRG